MKKTESPSVSRRSFINIATGTLAVLPAVAGGFLVPVYPREARADQLGTDGDAEPTAHLVIVKPNEVGIVLMDVSKAPRELLEGATITLTSRFNKKSLSGTTDKYGACVFDITDLSERGGIQPAQRVYAFNGTIEISASGYREVRIVRTRVEGGVGLAVPTRPLENGVPYPRSITLDEWDVLYTNNEFLSSTDEEYDIDHELAVELVGLPEGPVSVALCEHGAHGGFVDGMAVASSGTATVTLKDKFLWINDSNHKRLVDGMAYDIQYVVSNTTYTVPIQLSISKADADSPNPTISGDLKLAPFNDFSGFETGVHFPEGIPVIAGDSVVPWVPTWPVNVNLDPFGYLVVSYTSPSWGYISDSGSKEPDGWKKFPRATAKQQYDRWSGEIQERIWGTRANALDKSAKIQQVQAISVFKFGVSFTVMGVAEYAYADESARKWRGNFSLGATLSADYSLTETFTIGPIPFLIQFNVRAALTIKGNMGFTSPKAFSVKEYRWDYVGTGFTIFFVLAPSLSIGVGIKSVASASIRGALSVSIYIGVNPLPKGHGSNIKNPHIIIGVSATLTAVFQLLFYTKTVKISEYEEPNVYNSWGNAPSMQSADQDSFANLKEVVDGMEIVTAASLAERAEFSSVGFSTPRNGSFATPTSFLKAMQVEQTTDDGVTYRAKVFSRVTLEQASALLGHDSYDQTIFAGKQSATEQAAMVGEWKSKGLVPVWDSSELGVGALPSCSLMGQRSYVHTRPTFGADRLGALGGIHITSDIPISPNVLSDSRSQIVSIWGKPHVLRVGAVMVGKHARSRVIAQQIDTSGSATGAIYVLDFDAGAGVAPRDDLFDYDFDVVGTHETDDQGGERYDLHFLVFSGLREQGDSTGFVDASLDHLVSYVRWSFTDANDLGAQSVAVTGVDPDDIHAAVDPSITEDWYHLYASPQISLISDGSDRALVMSYLDRAGVTADDVFGDSDSNSTKVGVGMFFVALGTEFCDPVYPDLADLRGVIGEFGDLTVSEMTMSDRPADGYHTVMLRGSKHAHYLIVKTKAAVKYVNAEARQEGVAAEAADPAIVAAETAEPANTDAEVAGPAIVEVEAAQAQEGLANPQVEATSAPFVVPVEVAPDAGETAPVAEHSPATGSGVEPEANEQPAIEPAGSTQDGTAAPASVEPEAAKAVPGFSEIRRVPDDVFAGNERIQLVPVPNQPFFLAAAVPSNGTDSCLTKATWNVGDDISLDLSGYGPKGFVISKFCVHPTGNYIFWPALRDGNAAYTYDKDGNPSQDTENTYVLMGSRLRNDKFSDPFVLAEVDHPMDSMVVLDDEQDGMAFLSTHVVDANTAQGDVYYTVVEHAVCASVASAEAVMPVAGPKDKVSFFVAIRNDGNVFIKGLSISVEGMGSQKLTFSESSLVESSYNPRGDDGKLIGVEYDYALAPGKTSLYEVDGYEVPEDWAGTYDLKVTIDSGSVVPVSDTQGVAAEAADNLYRYEPAHEEMTQTMGDGTIELAGQATLRIHMPDQVAVGDFSDAPISTQKTASTGSAGPAGPAEAKNTSLARTGDATGGLGAISAALGLAGAALLAYSKRRSDLEGEQEDV